MTTDTTAAVSPVSAVTPITLHLTPVEFGVVVALVVIGISVMTSNKETLEKYREILTSADTQGAAFTAFETLVNTLETVTEPEAA